MQEIHHNPNLETIVDGLEPIALIIRRDFEEPGIHFFTPGNFSQQVALMRHDKGKKSRLMSTISSFVKFFTLKRSFSSGAA